MPGQAPRFLASSPSHRLDTEGTTKGHTHDSHAPAPYRAGPGASRPPPWPPERSSPAPPPPRPAWSPPVRRPRTSHVGGDNDNADNPFIQPPGVTAKQHMDNTDLLFGRANDDLLDRQARRRHPARRRGQRHPHRRPGEGGRRPNSDVLVGEEGNDINIWAPGDGSDAFAGNEGYDTMIFAPFVEKAERRPAADPLPTAARSRTSTSTARPPSAARSSRCRASREARLPVPGALQRQRQPGRDRPPEGRREGVLPEPGRGQGQGRRPDRRPPDVPRTSGCAGSPGPSARSWRRWRDHDGEHEPARSRDRREHRRRARRPGPRGALRAGHPGRPRRDAPRARAAGRRTAGPARARPAVPRPGGHGGHVPRHDRGPGRPRRRSWATRRPTAATSSAPARSPPARPELPILAVSRPLLEWYLRHRLLARHPGRASSSTRPCSTSRSRRTTSGSRA